MENEKKLTEEGEDYNTQCDDIMQDLREEGYLKRDIIGALNHCSKIKDFDVGSDIYLFIDGILWERERQKKLKKEVRNSSQP